MKRYQKEMSTSTKDSSLYIYSKHLEFVQGIPKSVDDDSFFDRKKNNVIMLDDIMSTASKNN